MTERRGGGPTRRSDADLERRATERRKRAEGVDLDSSFGEKPNTLARLRRRTSGVLREDAVDDFLRFQVVLFEEMAPNDPHIANEGLVMFVSRRIAGLESPVAT